jgi:HAD superfamily hydrolase (TIGR01509 family)
MPAFRQQQQHLRQQQRCSCGASIAAARRSRLIAGMTTSKAAGAATDAQRSVADAVDFARLTALLLDIDGTLTDSDPLHLKAFQEALVARNFNGGAPIDEIFYRTRISGRHNPEIARDLLPHFPEAEQVEFYEWKEARFRELAAGGALEPMRGLFAFLDWARDRGLRHAAVTNAPAANTDLMLAGIAVRDRFEHVVLGERCTRAKPHPDPYLEAARLLSVDPRTSLVVEDSPSGVKAGVAAGAVVVGITTSQPAEVLLEAGACCVIEDFEQLLAAAKAQGL